MTNPSRDTGGRAYGGYLDALQREIDRTPELTRGDIDETDALTRALTAIASLAAAENEMATGGKADATGLWTAPPVAGGDHRTVRTVSWRGTRYESTGNGRNELLDDAAALLLGTPWERTRWRRTPKDGSQRDRQATQGRVRRTPILDPGDAGRRPKETEHDALSEAVRTTDLFIITDMDTSTTSGLYRFNQDPDEDGDDPDRGYTRVPAGPLVSDLVGVLNTMVCRDTF